MELNKEEFSMIMDMMQSASNKTTDALLDNKNKDIVNLREENERLKKENETLRKENSMLRLNMTMLNAQNTAMALKDLLSNGKLMLSLEKMREQLERYVSACDIKSAMQILYFAERSSFITLDEEDTKLLEDQVMPPKQSQVINNHFENGSRNQLVQGDVNDSSFE